MASKEKPVKIHPDSPLGKIVIKMAEDKKMVQAYFRGEVSMIELESKGIKFVDPL